MARLYEYQSKRLLKNAGIHVPEGDLAFTPEEVRQVAFRIGKPVVLKIQVWLTGRAGLGGIRFAESGGEAEAAAREMFGMKAKNFVVDKLLVEEKLKIKSECFAGLVIDDARKAPVLIFSSVGGTGIEEIARKHPDKVWQIPVNIKTGLKDYEVRNLLQKAGLSGKLLVQLSGVLTRLYRVARRYDARSVEINPLVITEEDIIYAADCHLAIDDYAVYRHPELDIEVAREFDRPPTRLERIAYRVEENDHRGTFYFLQMTEEIPPEEKYIGFHGAGGGGSMMSMDAVLDKGFKLANYCDTSGNPSASKVYRAAKIILSQPNLKGYFASGSGVASQEQYHSARGMVKAFHEEKLEIPAVIRLGGNYEEEAIEILGTYLKDIPAAVEGYGRDDSPEFCAQRLEELTEKSQAASHAVRPMNDPELPDAGYFFETMTGRIFLDHQKCENCRTKGCIEACRAQILKLEEGKPVLSIPMVEARKGKCTECLACEIFCKFHEQDAVTIYLPIPGLKEYRDKLVKS
ncbi:MAG: acetate--CoA ligase family protein [Candidatus Aminicenantes bacterium]|nr:acetate--CoA ligase family protein [Candidatus Aminicenantes bacterium]